MAANRGFWYQLHRRRVLRVLVAYAIIAFVIVQGAVAAVDYLDGPTWVARASVWLALLGVPIVAVTAWYFDYTPWGVLRTPPEGELPLQPTGLLDRRVEAVIIGILLILLGFAIPRSLDDLAAARGDPPIGEIPD